jgi:SAM-dependent methyltransferase
MTFEDKPLSYEEKREFRYRLQDYMLGFFAFESLRGKLVLDLGSGSGIDSCEMIKHGAEVVSVDFSPLSCKSTKALLVETRFPGNVVMADARYLPLRSDQFDVIYSFGVIHHIPEISRVVREVSRCLREDGEFLGMVYHRDSLLYAYSLLYLHGIREGLFSKSSTEQEIASRFSERKEGNPYTKCYTKVELEDLLHQFFDFADARIFYNVIDTLQARKIKFRLENLSTDLGWHLAFKATKRKQLTMTE